MEIKTIAEYGHTPARKHKGAAGADMRAFIPRPVTIGVGESAWIALGVSMEIPEGYFGLQAPRSGLGCNYGICLSNGVGFIDARKRGPLTGKMVNHGEKAIPVYPGDRVCQMVIIKCEDVDFLNVDELSDSDRGANGYGSTGVE